MREEERKKKAEEEQREKEEQERREKRLAKEEKEKEKRLAKEKKEKEELRDDAKVGHPCYGGGETPICAGHKRFIEEAYPRNMYGAWETRCDFAEPMPGACETASGAPSKCCRRLHFLPVKGNPHDGNEMTGGCEPVEGAQCRNAFSSAGMETAMA